MLRSHPGPRGGDAPAATDRSELVGEIRALQARLAALTEQVGRNDSLLRKTQERELELLRAGSLSQLFERLIAGLRSSYQLDDVALILHDPQHEIRHLLSGDGLALEQLPRVCFVDALTTVAPQLVNLERPWLGPFHKADHELLLPGVARAESLALIPLRRHEQLDGVLVFSSVDPLRFTQELARDFLAHLGLVAGICIENAVNGPRRRRSGCAVPDGERGGARGVQAVRPRPVAVGKGVAEPVTLSIGVAAATPGPGMRDYKALAERLMAEADAALYRAKSAGRNRIATSPNLVS